MKLAEANKKARRKFQIFWNSKRAVSRPDSLVLLTDYKMAELLSLSSNVSGNLGGGGGVVKIMAFLDTKIIDYKGRRKNHSSDDVPLKRHAGVRLSAPGILPAHVKTLCDHLPLRSC